MNYTDKEEDFFFRSRGRCWLDFGDRVTFSILHYGWKISKERLEIPPTNVDEEGLAVEQVGELVEGLRHDGPAGLRHVHASRQHRGGVGAVLGGQEEVALRVRLVVQEGDARLARLARVVLHLHHQV